MKKFVFLTVLFIFISCASPKGIILPPEPVILPSFDIKPSSIKNPEPETQVPEKQRLFLSCEEKTKSIFNSSGFEVLPFIRTISYDIDNDGTEELIAGSKDGFLRLYKRSVINDTPGWTLIEKYFDGIKQELFLHLRLVTLTTMAGQKLYSVPVVFLQNQEKLSFIKIPDH